MTIAVDVHEPASIVRGLKALGIEVYQVKLPVGDYTWNNIGIERKTVNDFYSSVYRSMYTDSDSNLFNQLYQLKQYPIPILIIIGNLFTRWKYRGRKRVTIDNKEFKTRLKIATTILSKLPIKYGIYHYIVPNQSMFLRLVYSLYINTHNKETFAPVKRKGKTLEEIKENIITCVPGFGRKRARALLKDYTSIMELCQSLDSPSISLIENKIGKKLTRKLKESLTT